MAPDPFALPPACAFTGHRPQKLPWKNNEADPACVALKAMLAAQIEKLYHQGIKHYLSGMALGTDTFCSLAVLALREKEPSVKLHCVLPCKSQADEWDEMSRERYFSILDQADSIIYVSREQHKDCMMERNDFLIRYATTVLAVYTGGGRSGTAATVRRARKQGRDQYMPEWSSQFCEQGKRALTAEDYCIADSWLTQGYCIKRLHLQERRVVFRRVIQNVSGIVIPRELVEEKQPDEIVYEVNQFFKYIMKKVGRK